MSSNVLKQSHVLKCPQMSTSNWVLKSHVQGYMYRCTDHDIRYNHFREAIRNNASPVGHIALGPRAWFVKIRSSYGAPVSAQSLVDPSSLARLVAINLQVRRYVARQAQTTLGVDLCIHVAILRWSRCTPGLWTGNVFLLLLHVYSKWLWNYTAVLVYIWIPDYSCL